MRTVFLAKILVSSILVGCFVPCHAGQPEQSEPTFCEKTFTSFGLYSRVAIICESGEIVEMISKRDEVGICMKEYGEDLAMTHTRKGTDMANFLLQQQGKPQFCSNFFEQIGLSPAEEDPATKSNQSAERELTQDEFVERCLPVMMRNNPGLMALQAKTRCIVAWQLERADKALMK